MAAFEEGTVCRYIGRSTSELRSGAQVRVARVANNGLVEVIVRKQDSKIRVTTGTKFLIEWVPKEKLTHVDA